MLTKTPSESPLATPTDEHPNANIDASKHPAKRATQSRKVRANIDDRFKAVERRPTSRIDPWISNYVLVYLKSRSNITRYHPKEAPMIEILNRGGPFWDYTKHTDDSIQLEGWLLVSDGLHSIKVWLSEQCREAIWQEVTQNKSNPMYAFHNYSARQCGLLQSFHIKPIQVKSASLASSCELVCDAFQCQPQMQYMVVSDPSQIQDVNDYVEVKHAFQAYCKFHTSGIKLGNVKEVVDNPQLCAAILKAAERQMEQENRQKAKANDNGVADAAITTAAVPIIRNAQHQQRNDDEDDVDDDDDGVPAMMNIQGMLASPEQNSSSQTCSSKPNNNAKRDLTQALSEALPKHGIKKSKVDDDETDFMGSLPNSAILALNSQPSPTPPTMQSNKKAVQSQDADDDDDVIELVETRKPIQSKLRKQRIQSMPHPLYPGRIYRFRRRADWPNLPAFSAFCKQLNDPSRHVVNIPEIQQPRVKLTKHNFGQWLDKLGM